MIQRHPLSTFRIRAGRIAMAVVAAAVTTAAWALQPHAVPSAEPAADANASEVVSYRRQFSPAYPKTSLDSKAEGHVVLEVRVNTDGTATEHVSTKSTATPNRK